MNYHGLHPLHDRVVVQPCKAEGKTPGGIIIPETAQKKAIEGVVVAVGHGRLNERGERMPMHVRAGQRVIYEKHSGTEIERNGEVLLILQQDSILAVVE